MESGTQNYMEERPITLPKLQHGPSWIGDLWNCQDSSYVGFNLFSGLKEEDLRVDHFEHLDYQLTHIRSSKDRQKSVEVHGEIALELRSGLIKVEGTGDFDDKTTSNSLEEELICHYNRTNHVIQTETSAYNCINEMVRDKILNGEIKATHIVSEVHLGAALKASVKIRDTSESAQIKAGGSFMGKFAFGAVSASVKLALGFLDTDDAKNFEKTITFKGQPGIKLQPQSIQEMFEAIDTISDVIKAITPPVFQNSEKEVHGVAISFYLVPISQFLKIKIERLYLKLKDEMVKQLDGMLTKLQDFQEHYYIAKQILISEPRLKRYISDPQNNISKNVAEYDEKLKSKAKEFHRASVEYLSEYRIQKKQANDMLTLLTEYHQKFNLIEIHHKINNFIQQGRQELLGISAGSITGKECVEIFTNLNSMNNWNQNGNCIKLLFQSSTDGSTANTLSKIYEISESLTKLGIEIGVATPTLDGNTASKSKLTIKINNDNYQVFEQLDDIRHVVRVLGILVNVELEIITRFFIVHCSLRSLPFPWSEHTEDLLSLIEILKPLRSVNFANSYLQIRQNLGEEGEYKIVISLECLTNAVQCVATFNRLRIEFESKVTFIIGTFGISENDSSAPLAFLFRNEALLAICFNNLDILLLITAFSETDQASRDSILEILEPSYDKILRNCWNPSSARFAMRVVNMFSHSFSSLNSIENTKISSTFPDSGCKMLLHLSCVLKGFLTQQPEYVFNGMGRQLLAEFPGLAQQMKSCGWSSLRNGFVNLTCKTFMNQLREVLLNFRENTNPFQAKIQIFLALIRKDEKSIDEINLSLKRFVRMLNAQKNCEKNWRLHRSKGNWIRF